ncbi:hypothetical protein ONS96_005666 [Cadophora gregata f. sp. sojae]|nr:hypothetical protein ONS96_005666 [Cadophora gregata f. sp. sojae]
MVTNEITGNLRDRFIQGAVLLYLIDPVRAEPSAYGLDKDSNLLDHPQELFLKRKFLDSFALICAIKKDPKSVSAACLEEGQPESTVVRIASNGGVAPDTVRSLQGLVDMLGNKAMKDVDPSELERAVLLKIIQLDIVKIRDYMKRLKTSHNFFDVQILEVQSRLVDIASEATSPSIQNFLDWFEQLFSIRNLPNELTPTVLLGYIVWAQKAKRAYYKYLSLAFAGPNGCLPRWVKVLFKLGRYGIAAKAFVQTSINFPALFDSMIVEAVSAPPRVYYALQDDKKPLDRVLRRVPEVRVEDAIPRLSSIWSTNNPETTFRDSCPEMLVTHAEIQLISFYDHNPTLRPHVRFIGVSKKSCYLCWRFLQTHPSGFYVSSCHQKLYPSWIPAPSTDLQVYKKYKQITLDMSVMMEKIAREELIGRLGLKRLMPADSTAGVSLSGLTELGKTGIPDCAGRGGVKIDFASASGDAAPERHEALADIESPSNNSRYSSASDLTSTCTRQNSLETESGKSISSMVFRFKDQRDQKKQDIITIDSIVNPDTQLPSWSKLLDLLNSEDSFGLVFRDSDFLFVNNSIRIRNERQFLACLQWLLNEGVWNAEAMICDSCVSPQDSGDQGMKGEV